VPALLASVLVIVTGAAVLIIETLAARLVAPYVGLTLESYTAAIGVALLGIAAGARIGGRLADRLPPRRVITAALVAAGLLVLAVRPIVHVVGPAVPPGPVSAVLLIALSTLAPVLVLSMVAPAVVKARLDRLEESGSVVGSLSALGTLGALAGTFLTGFVLIATLPTGVILAATAGTLLVLAAVAAVVRPPSAVARTSVAALALGGLLLVVDGPCQVETAYYCARISADPVRESGRVLYLDDLRHSYVDLDDPAYLHFRYAQRFADVIDAAFPGKEPLDALHLGGGGFTMPRWIAATRPGSQSTVLELDPAVVEIGRSRLGLGEVPGVEVVVGDGRTSLQRQPDQSADVVVGDAFGSLSVPWHLATEEFMADVRRVLRPDGVYVLNVIDYGPLAFLRAEAATVAAVFDEVGMLIRPDQLTGRGGNAVLVASNRPLPWESIAAAAAARGEPGSVLHAPAYDDFVGDAPVLTDGFAPVEQLLTPYVPR
jgi:SAM-dependent methyltransferase